MFVIRFGVEVFVIVVLLRNLPVRCDHAAQLRNDNDASGVLVESNT